MQQVVRSAVTTDAVPLPDGAVMVDISASVTTNGMSNRLQASGELGQHAWWLDAEGRPTADPEVFFAEPAGTLTPGKRADVVVVDATALSVAPVSGSAPGSAAAPRCRRTS